jgi:hypothetical protein
MGDTDAPMAGHLFLDFPGSVVVGIAECKHSLRRAMVLPLLTARASQWNNYVVEKVCLHKRRAMWQQVHEAELLRVEENRQH